MLRRLYFVVAGLAAMALLVGEALAGDYYTSVPFLPSVKTGPDAEGATPVDKVYGKEYSHTDWFSVYHGFAPYPMGDPNLLNVEDHDAFAAPDPLQVVSWDGMPGRIGGNSGSVDAFDYSVTGFNYPDREVDALANHQDLLFQQVVRGDATLLFSVTGDLDASTVLPPAGSGSSAGIVAKAHVHWEAPAGPSAGLGFGHGIWAAIEAPPAGPGGGPGVNHHVVEDLDALEVWGPEPPSHNNPDNPTPVKEGYIGGFGAGANTADADRFSLDNDAANGGISVWAYSIPTGFVTPWIPQSEIVAAVEELFLGPGKRFDDETRRQIDVDATMAQDLGIVSDTAPASWGPGDELLFSIDPISGGSIVDSISGALLGPAMPIDGGEIMHLTKTAPGLGPGTFAISFLIHGGHPWNTAFPVATTFGYYYEDVDALEAVGTLTGETDIPTPEPASLATILIGLVVGGLWRRHLA
jgi:hypothetical protein